MSRTPAAVVALTAAAMLAALTGCGEDEPAPAPAPSSDSTIANNTTVTPSKPLGSVSGTVLDGSKRPLSGAAVRLQLGTAPEPALTDDGGHFTFAGLPAGSVVGVEISADEHATAYRQVTIPSSAGNFPIDDASAFVGPVALYELSATLTVSVIGYDGRAVTATGAFCEASASWADWSSGYENALGPLMIDATAAEGSLTCAGLPRFIDLARNFGNLEIFVPALSVEGDAAPEYDGLHWSVSAADALAAGGTISLVLPEPGHTEDLRIIATNALTLLDGPSAILDSAVPADRGIEIAFSRRVEVLEARLFDETGEVELATTVDRAATGSSIRVRPEAVNSWPKGQELNLTLSVVTADGQRQTRTFRAPILTLPDVTPIGVATKDPADPSRSFFLFDDGNVNGSLESGETVHFVFTQAIGYGNGNPFAIPVYFEFNIDADVSASIGDYYAELGSENPAVARSAEPNPRVGVYSGFTSFASLIWNSGYSIPINARVWAAFDDQALVGEPIFTPDGRPLTVPLSAELRQAP